LTTFPKFCAVLLAAWLSAGGIALAASAPRPAAVDPTAAAAPKSGGDPATPAAEAPPAEAPVLPATPRALVIPIEMAPVEPAVGAASGRAVPLPVVKPRPLREKPTSKADVEAGGVVSVPLNMTRPFDLPGTARDVMVGNPAIADVLVRSPRQVFVTGRKLGDTNIFVLGEAGQVLRRVQVHVGPDAESAQAAIAKLLPDDDIEVTTVGDSLFLTGKVRTQQAVNSARTIARRFVAADANVVNQLTMVGAQQVMLRVRVAEMQRTVVKQLGMRTFFAQGSNSVNGIINGGNVSGVNPGGIAPGNPSYTFPVTGGTPPTAANPSGTPPTQSQPLFGALPGTGNIFGGGGEYSTLANNNPGSWFSVVPWNLLVNFAALESEGLAKTLAEPNLMTTSGEAARLLAGGEIPIPAASINGVVTVQWKPFGVGLVFSPVILSNGDISLKLESEVSAIDNSISVSTGSGISVPGFKTRRATSVVELPSGGSLMIAGLLEDNASNAINAVPGIRDLPLIGPLFGSTAFQRNETELVITVTAYLVDPVDHQALNLPTDGFIPSSDLKRYFLMRLQENYVGKPIDVPPAALKGPIGYIVE
jgi:pilus assembly protein CpaC